MLTESAASSSEHQKTLAVIVYCHDKSSCHQDYTMDRNSSASISSDDDKCNDTSKSLIDRTPVNDAADPKTAPEDDSNGKVFEHISDLTGDWGPFQRQLFILLCLVYFVAPFNNAGVLFYATKVKFRCTSFTPEWIANGSQAMVDTPFANHRVYSNLEAVFRSAELFKHLSIQFSRCLLLHQL